MSQVESEVVLDGSGSGPDLPSDAKVSITTVVTEEESTVSLTPSQQVEESSPRRDTIESRTETWTNQTEFLLSCISMSVGLGNVWRFPYIAYNNGGGAFLIPYMIVLIAIGRPLYFLELCMGQFSSHSQVRVWSVVPFFRGVGYVSMMATIVILSYYCSVLAMTVFYFCASFSKTLPWTVCNPDWKLNCTEILLTKNTAEHYLTKDVLHEKTQIDDGIGNPDWRLAVCLFGSWTFICFSLIRGVKSLGKVAYVTTIFPYVILVILLIRGLTLEGAWIGIKAFITPNWTQILSPRVWYEAVSQCFYSLSTGFGSIILFSSCNPFDHNIYRDAMILSFLDTATSFIAGLVVFSVLGFLSVKTGRNVTDILGTGGSGLAFISYPTAIAEFPLPQVFGALFFLMLFFLGIGSAMAYLGAVVSVLLDMFPRIGRIPITVGLCIATFLLGLIYTTPGGQFMLNLADFCGVTLVVFIASVLEVIGISWVYGINNIVRDVDFMLGRHLSCYWTICWAGIMPISLIIILVYSLIDGAGELTYNGVAYPLVATVCGWLLCFACISPFVICAVRACMQESGTLTQRFRKANSPNDQWGPHGSANRERWEDFKQNYQNRNKCNSCACLPKKLRCVSK